MKFKCITGLCDGQTFVLDAAREARVVKARLRDMESLLIDCPSCRVASEMRLRPAAEREKKERKESWRARPLNFASWSASRRKSHAKGAKGAQRPQRAPRSTRGRPLHIAGWGVAHDRM